MTIDPRLQALFLQAEQAFDRDTFRRGVMARIDLGRRRLLVVWAGLSIAGIAVLVMLAPPVIAALTMATDLLPVSLVDVETEWVRQLLAPINSVAAAVALGVLGLRRFIRRIFG